MKEGPNPSRKDLHPRIKKGKYGIIYAEWNLEITGALRDGAIELLKEVGVSDSQITVSEVSGAFELPVACRYFLDSGRYDGIIAIGCLVKGDTPHFHYISEVVSHRLSELSVDFSIPIGFGLLTVNKYFQAKERAGGIHGNKGREATEAVLNLLNLKYSQFH